MFVLLVALGSSACEQAPDVVAYSIGLDGGGGLGGAGGAGGGGAAGAAGMIAAGGMGGVGGEPMGMACDPELSATVGTFYGVVAADCRVDAADSDLVTLLREHILSREPVILDPEAAPPDVLCNLLSPSPEAPIPARPIDPRADLRWWQLCPAYCESLKQWITEHEPALQNCL